MAPDPTTPAPAASTPATAPAAASTPTVAPAAAAPAAAASVAPAAAPATPKPAEGAASTDAKPAEGVKPAESESLLKPPEVKSDTKPGEPAKAIPAEVEVKVPEGTKVNGALVDEFKTLAKANGLNSETAQKVFDLGLKMQQSFADDMDRQLEEYKTESISTLRKEWGPQFEGNVQAAQKVINKFGDPALLNELNGLECSPAVMRTLAAIGRAMGEDSIAIPGTHSVPAPSPGKSRTGDAMVDLLADSLYPTMNKD